MRLEKIFHNWLSESKEEKSKHNPFLEMFAEIHKRLPYVEPPHPEQIKCRNLYARQS